MSRKTLKLLLLICQVIYVVILPIWLIVSPMSAMMFDSPGSESLIWLALLFYFILAYPIGVIIAIIGSWIFFRKRKAISTLVFNFLPLLWILPAGIFILWGLIIS